MSDRNCHYLAAAPGADLPLSASAEQQSKLAIFRTERTLFENHHLEQPKHFASLF